MTSKLANPLSVREAAAIVADLTTIETHSPTGVDVLGAIDIHARVQLSFWDAMVIRSASQPGCTVVWSEDLTPGETYEGVEVRNPFL